jgi:UDP-glucose 4-epimerase
VYGNPAHVPVSEDDALMPMSPYGSSKLMTEIMLRDASAANGFSHVILRYFNVAGADPELGGWGAPDLVSRAMNITVRFVARPSCSIQSQRAG